MARSPIHPRILERCVKNQAIYTRNLLVERDRAVSLLEHALTLIRKLARSPGHSYAAAHIVAYESAIAQLKEIDPAALPCKNSIFAIGQALQRQVGELSTQTGESSVAVQSL